MTNLLTGDSATFTSTLGTWVVAAAGTNYTLAWVTGGFMRYTVTTGGVDIAASSSGSAITNKIPVTPGQVLTLSMKARQTAGATFRNVRIDGQFFDSTQTTTIPVPANIVADTVTATGAYQTLSGAITVPAGSAYVRLRAFAIAPAAGDVFEWDDASVDDGVVAGVVKPKVKTGTIKSATGTVKITTTMPTANTIVGTSTTEPIVAGLDYNINAPDTAYAYRRDTYSNAATVDRFELRSGDRAPSDIAQFPTDNRQRCELVEQTRPVMGTDMWTSFGFRWSGTMSTTVHNIFVQYHQPADATESIGKNPGWIFECDENEFRIAGRNDPNPTTDTLPPQIIWYATTPWLANTWYQVVMRTRFGPSGNGGYSFYVNGALVSEQLNIGIGYNDPDGPRLAVGQYREGFTGTTVIEYANWEYKVDGSSLLARVANPKPLP